MHCTWQVTIVRLNGKPDLEYTEVRGRTPTPSDVLERCSSDGETVRGRVGSWHHVRPKGPGNSLGVYEIRAGEIA
jgi:hypothetical protein